RMVLEALGSVEVAQALIDSQHVRVRGWALWRLEQGLRAAPRLSLAEPYLWRLARDPSASLRVPAAHCLWRHAPQKDDALLLRLLESLEAAPVDAPVPLAEFLRQLGVADVTATRLLEVLEQARPMQCPLCGAPLTAGARASHLQNLHGYLEVGGDVLPADVALARLWERALLGPDPQAHDRLLELYLRRPGGGGPERYAADLEKQLLGPGRPSQLAGTNVPVALPFSAYSAVVSFLRQSPHLRAVAPALLLAPRGRLRELGREALVPALADRLSGQTTGADVGRALEEVCPGLDLAGEKLVLCDRLSLAGVDQAALSDCAARLREERLVHCPECADEMRARDLEAHLRRAHGIFEFRGR